MPYDIFRYYVAQCTLFGVEPEDVNVLEELYDEETYEALIHDTLKVKGEKPSRKTPEVDQVLDIMDEQEMSWTQYKRARNVRLDLPATKRMILHQQRARALGDLAEVKRRIQRDNYVHDQARQDDFRLQAQLSRLAQKLKQAWPGREAERVYYERLVYNDPRFRADLKAGYPFEKARQRWRKRQRSVRHEAAQRLIAAHLRQERAAETADLDAGRELVPLDEEAPEVEEDAANTFGVVRRAYTPRELKLLRLQEDEFSNPVPGDRALRRLLEQARMFVRKVTNEDLDDAGVDRHATEGVAQHDAEFSPEDFDDI
jgi:hypothetical protein